jgi:hypothetical protein
MWVLMLRLLRTGRDARVLSNGTSTGQRSCHTGRKSREQQLSILASAASQLATSTFPTTLLTARMFRMLRVRDW